MTNQTGHEEHAAVAIPEDRFQILPVENPAELQTMFADIIETELGGMDKTYFETIKIPSGGGLFFEIPGETEDRPQNAPELLGVIIDHHPLNALWVEKYNGTATQPSCCSFDGKQGVDMRDEVRSCDTCPFNQFGSAQDGSKGKACKNMHRIYLQVNGQLFPYVLTLPPSSISNWKNYLVKRLIMRRKRPHSVISRITLKRAKSEGGITYSQAVFSMVRDLTAEELQEVEFLAPAVKRVSRNHQLYEVAPTK